MFRKDSELSLFNQHESQQPFHMSPEIVEVFRISQKVSEESGGAFDITMGPLVNAWGFGPDTVTASPDKTRVAALRERTGYQWVEVRDNNSVVKKRPDIYCDLSAVAKGYGVDKTAEALDRLGLCHYLIEVGGEVRTRGLNADREVWRLAIEKPVDEEQVCQMVVSLPDTSLATSGDYRIYRDDNGVRYSHEIDPRTGCPVMHSLASVSVIHPSCAWADAYATALMVLGPDEGYQFALEQHLAISMMIRTDGGDFQVRKTPALTKFICNE